MIFIILCCLVYYAIGGCNDYQTPKECITGDSLNCGYCYTTEQCVEGNSKGPLIGNCSSWVWQGHDSCPIYSNCDSCTNKLGCIWCESSGTCMGGDHHGPFNSSCLVYSPDSVDCLCKQKKNCQDCNSVQSCGWCSTTNLCSVGSKKGQLYGLCLGWCYGQDECQCAKLNNCGDCISANCSWCSEINTCLSSERPCFKHPSDCECANNCSLCSCEYCGYARQSSCNWCLSSNSCEPKSSSSSTDCFVPWESSCQCLSLKNCSSCTSNFNCGWCESSSTCLAQIDVSYCPNRDQNWYYGTCNKCSKFNSSCHNCIDNFYDTCGWCESDSNCYSGNLDGPYFGKKCDSWKYYTNQCYHSCLSCTEDYKCWCYDSQKCINCGSDFPCNGGDMATSHYDCKCKEYTNCRDCNNNACSWSKSDKKCSFSSTSDSCDMPIYIQIIIILGCVCAATCIFLIARSFILKFIKMRRDRRLNQPQIEYNSKRCHC